MSTITYLSKRWGITTPEVVRICKIARCISPSWSAHFVADEDSVRHGFVHVGAFSGGLEDAVDTYCIARVGLHQVELSNIREDFAVIGMFRSVNGAVNAMQNHAAAIRY